MAALTRHNRNNVLYNKVFLLLVGGSDLDKRSSVGVSVAPAGSFYSADWLMYSDQPESTVLARKGIN